MAAVGRLKFYRKYFLTFCFYNCSTFGANILLAGEDMAQKPTCSMAAVKYRIYCGLALRYIFDNTEPTSLSTPHFLEIEL